MLKRFSSCYEIQETLGESALSFVYLARRVDKKLKIRQTLIIKLFKEKESPALALQMESLLRARHSSHLVKALSFERFKGRPALIMEYISAVNLKDLARLRTLSQDEVHCICAQVLEGLRELKRSHLSHGDLSLSNILISPKGHVYLTDYGLANYAKGAYGTKPFAAGELYRGKNKGFLSDLFSLGVLEKVLKGGFSEAELSAMESKDFVLTGDTLLDPEPEKRSEKVFAYSPKALSVLGDRAREILSLRENFQIDKKAFVEEEGFARKKPFSATRIAPNFLPSIDSKGRQKSAWWFWFLPFLPFKKAPLRWGVICFLLLAVDPFVSYGKYKVDKEVFAVTHVFVRTKEWVHVRLAGVSGYAPIDFSVKTPGSYKMVWKKEGANGIKYIYLAEGQKITLKDKDF